MTAKARISAINRFISGCKADNIYNDLQAACVMAGWDGLAGALTPLVGASPTNNGFLAADFDRGNGLKGNGSSKYLDSNRANNADPQDSKHLAVYATTTSSAFKVYAGSSFDTSLYRAGDSDLLTRVNRGTVFTVVPGAAAATGLIAANRPAFGTTQARAGGTTVSESLDANTHISENTAIFARLLSGSASEISDATLSFYSIGSSLSLEDLDTSVTDLMNRIRFALVTGENPAGLDSATIDYVLRGYDAGGTLA